MAFRKTGKTNGGSKKTSYSGAKRATGKSFAKKSESSSRFSKSKPDNKKQTNRFSDTDRPARKYSSPRGEERRPRTGGDKPDYRKKTDRFSETDRPVRKYSSPRGEERRPRSGGDKPDYKKKTDRFSETNRPARKYSSPRGEERRPRSSENKPDYKKQTDRPARKYSSGHSRNLEKTSGTGKREEDTRESRFSKSSESRIFKGDKEERAPRTRTFKKDSFDKGGKTYEKTKRSDSGFDKKREYKTGKKSFDKVRKPRVLEEDHVEEPVSENVRLNRYIANAGICSRREADKLISTGLVSVNGTIITEMGYQVQPGDDVRFNGQRLSREKKVYIVMNKPKDAITTLDDPEGRNTVMDVLGSELRERVFPIGRLDRNTTGVLLLTNDGELAQRLMHPKYEVEKVYKATLNKVLKGEDLWQLTNGVELEDGFIKPDEVAYPDSKVKSEVGVQIHSGRNRIIHRMFEHLGYVVDKLDRVSYGGFVKTGLKRGEWRHLNDKELKKLKRLVRLG